MLIVTTPTLLPEYEIVEYLGFVTSRSMIEISDKGLIGGFIDRNVNEDQNAFDQFARQAGSMKSNRGKANAVVGVAQTNSTATFTNGTFLYVTYSGTAVVVEKVKHDADA